MIDRLSLPCDIIMRIRMHLAAMSIQCALRRYLFRHTRHALWCTLRRHLLAHVRPEQMQVLQGSGGVRSEWRNEPGSWRYVDGQLAAVLVSEIHAGLWMSSA